MSNCYVVSSPAMAELGFNPTLGVFSDKVSFAELAIKFPKDDGYVISIRPLGNRITNTELDIDTLKPYNKYFKQTKE